MKVREGVGPFRNGCPGSLPLKLHYSSLLEMSFGAIIRHKTSVVRVSTAVKIELMRFQLYMILEKN